MAQDFTPLPQAYQTLLTNAPQQGHISDALWAAGVKNTFSTPLGGFVVSDVTAAQAIIDTESNWLPYAKVKKVIDCQAAFDSIIAAGRIIGVKTYQIDDASRSAMQQTYNAGAAAFPINWIAMDNTTVALTQAQFQAGCQNILAYYNAMVLNRRALKNAVAAATTYVQLQTIDLNSGWPPNP